MAIFHPHRIQCGCGKFLDVQLARSVNAVRTPQLRDAILEGTFHSVVCTACQRRFTVERPFTYTDLSRRCLFLVKPRSRRHEFRRSSASLDRAMRSYQAPAFESGKLTLRAVFGLDELREKLLAQDAGIDDRVLELLKVLVIYEHPVLLRRPRLRLSVDEVNEASLEFTSAYEHGDERFRISMPRRIADQFIHGESNTRAWAEVAHQDESLFKQKHHWVNLWRWSPQPAALDSLRRFAETARRGGDIALQSQEFARMLSGLPRGAHLPPWAKRDLHALESHVQKKGGLAELEDRLFEIRFGFALADDWAANEKPDDIATLWQLLDALPDSNVEGNTRIRQILLGEGGGGVYYPDTHDIEIGEDLLADEQGFQDVVRHEVGHAVHEMLDLKVNGWLGRLGWRTFTPDDDGIDGWVTEMGGWGTLTALQKSRIRSYLRSALGAGGEWQPGQLPPIPLTDAWNKPKFGPRLAYEQTGANWFRNYRTWHRANGKAFFLNYWYRTLIAVDESLLKLVDDMPSSYAAMSHFEFFAELYALYFDADNPAGQAKIPAAIATWLADNVAVDKLPAVMPAPRPPKKDYETIERPKGARPRPAIENRSR